MRTHGFDRVATIAFCLLVGITVCEGVRRSASNLLRVSRCDLRHGKTATDLHMIADALERFAMDHSGAYPERLETLMTWDTRGGPYLEGRFLPKDLWGRDYLYDPPGAGHDRPCVFTYGRDGKPGGENDDEDLDDRSASRN